MIGIAHCLWFDGQAESAARHYVSIFGGTFGRITRYGEEGFEIHGRPAGSVMTVEFEVVGQRYIGVNGGPLFQFNEAFSIQVLCDTQEEIDRYWERLTDGGEEGPCGWCKDRFGLSWQVVPTGMEELFAEGADPARAQRAMQAMLGMRRIDVAALRAAAAGESAPAPA